jgi:hypothetical protein
MKPNSPTHAAARATKGLPSTALSFPPSRSRTVDMLNIMRNKVQKTSETAIQAGVVAAGDSRNVGAFPGSKERSERKKECD